MSGRRVGDCTVNCDAATLKLSCVCSEAGLSRAWLDRIESTSLNRSNSFYKRRVEGERWFLVAV